MATGVRQAQTFTGGEKQIEKLIAVFEADLTVAGTRLSRHEIELKVGLWARKLAIIEANDKEVSIRQITQAWNGRKGDLSARGGALSAFFEALIQCPDKDAQGEFGRVFGLLQVLVEFVKAAPNGLVIVSPRLFIRDKVGQG